MDMWFEMVLSKDMDREAGMQSIPYQSGQRHASDFPLRSSTLLFVGWGLILLPTRCNRRRRTAALLAGGLVTALASGPVEAQTNAAPDYSQVSDVLDGQRTLLQVTDLMVTAYDQKLGGFFSNPITTSNSQQTPQTQYRWRAYAGAAGPSYSARMYNQPYATTITTGYNDVYPGSGTRPYLDLLLQNGTNTSKWQLYRPLRAGDSPTVASGVAADFTLNGYDDLALGLNDGRLLIVTPNDPNNVQGGFRTSLTPLDMLSDMTAGDFKGDGGHEIAGLTISNGGLKLVIYAVDPQTLAVTLATSLMLTTPGTGPSAPITLASIARGRFNTANHDQLAVAFTTAAGPAYVEVIDFEAGTLTPHEASPTLGSPAGNIGFPYGYIQVKTGQFGLPTNRYDQIVYHSSSPQNGGRFFEILTVDQTTFAIAGTAPVTYNQFPGAVGIQVGNFDHKQANGQPNLNAQIAFVYYASGIDSSGNQKIYMNIYNVDASSLNVSGVPESITNLTGKLVPSNAVQPSLSFAATDLQGRSCVLGAPTKVVVESSIQPSVIAAMPPMHVDFVPPANSSEPELLNLSVIPSGFNTTYQTTQTNTNQSSTINTTSWSFGAQQTLDVGFEIGRVDAGLGLKGSSISTAAQDQKGSIETEHGRYTQTRFDASVTTGFGDSVWYSSSRFNIWVYPVLGQIVCPAGAGANCPAKKPLTIQFSAPDDIKYARRDGALLPWYQPVWEPGNVFSYPANYLQLQAIAPNLKLLSTPRSLATDNNKATESISWDSTQTNGSSASFDQNYSFSQEFSLTGFVSTPFASASLIGTLNFSGSNGFSDLNKSVTSLGKSTGISVNKPGSFANPGFYAYSFTPYIFGQNQSASVVDEAPLDADVKTHGLLRTAFLADPLAESSNVWWQQTYNQPDVALNHPQRWLTRSGAVVAGNPSPSNCLNTDCVFLQESNPKNPWLSPFHFMRGFFISNAQNPGRGPQLDTAQAGDQLTLQARVYNYSLKAMPPDSKVHVRFYVQPFDKNTHNPIGDSILIGAPDAFGNQDVVLDPIPPFRDDGAEPNWKLASTDFDTTPYGGQHLVFWVIIWAQDSSGKLLQEMPGHGLKGVPGELKSFADVQMEEQYSNNVGLYNSEFYVFPDNASLTAAGSGEPGTIDIGKIKLSSESAVPGQMLDVSAQLSATENSASGVEALFYEGDPNAGGTAFGYELSPYIGENDTYEVKAPYVASACGTHQLFVVVGQGTSHQIVRRAPPVRVDCNQSMPSGPVGSASHKPNLK